MRGWGQRERLEAAAAVWLLFLVCGCTPLHTASPTQQGAAQVKEMPPAKAGGRAWVSEGSIEVPYIPPPNSIDLCGEPVPLDNEAVYERFDKEFTLVVYNHAQVYLWLKRMQRYFPMIEKRLRYYGLPDDLKYVAIAESDLLPDACSPKGAAGPWQFMRSTGAAYGLEQKGSVDTRYDFKRSTDSAFLLLKNLYDKYHSWPLALAAYNCGEKRVSDACRIQGVHDYYELSLPEETERYVFRILAIKAVLGNPSKYGYNLPKAYGYKALKVDRVTVSLRRSVPIRTIASAAGTTFSEIKRLNPKFRSDNIPAGNHEIKLPYGTRTVFERNFKGVSPEIMLTQKQDSPAYAAPAAPRTSASAPSQAAAVRRLVKKRSPESKRKTRPTRAVSHRIERKTRLAKAGSHEVRRKTKPARTRFHRAKKKTIREKARSHRAKQRTRLARTVSHRVNRKTRLVRAKSHEAKKKTRREKPRPHKARFHSEKLKARVVKARFRRATRKPGRRLADR